MATMDTQKMVDELSTWSVMEVANLIKALEEKWGVKAAPVAVAGPAAGGGAAAPAAEAQTEFTVELTDAGAKKLDVIKALREINPALTLPEAKALAESAPKAVKEAAPKAEAEEIKKKLEAAGAKVTLK